MEIVLKICGVFFVASVLICLVRMVKGPTVLDRILAFDAITICVVGMMVLLSVRWQSPYFMELIIIFSLLGFLGSVAFIFYLQTTLPDPPSEEEHPPAAALEDETEGARP